MGEFTTSNKGEAEALKAHGTAEKIHEFANSYILDAEDICVHSSGCNYGVGEQSPWDVIKFYDPWRTDDTLWNLPDNLRAHFPQEWQAFSIRVYCRSANRAKWNELLEAFKRWRRHYSSKSASPSHSVSSANFTLNPAGAFTDGTPIVRGCSRPLHAEVDEGLGGLRFQQWERSWSPSHCAAVSARQMGLSPVATHRLCVSAFPKLRTENIT
eukprot:Gregarina_sp_Poly_1__7098@NODE_3882_length_840_cov_89_461837_g2507_i0_p1_GENE_NODE_3882_length_840_cov_89_461837_g2507_i0NODE_3882_length_840_cov_89_461837_g2507_i0_p1_ORF_typecomplete_len212_score32_15_NODE_3882_length_840_cov_89_461837_g2507_i0158793